MDDPRQKFRSDVRFEGDLRAGEPVGNRLRATAGARGGRDPGRCRGRRRRGAHRQPARQKARGGGAGPLWRDRALPLLYAEAFLLMGIFISVYNYAGFRLLAPPYRLNQAVVGAVLVMVGARSACVNIWLM